MPEDARSALQSKIEKLSQRSPISIIIASLIIVIVSIISSTIIISISIIDIIIIITIIIVIIIIITIIIAPASRRWLRSLLAEPFAACALSASPSSTQDSSKGGAVEAGCTGLHYVIGCFIV